MFEQFHTTVVDTGSAKIFVRHGGDGPAVYLLHGHPRTSATWHRVAPLLLAEGFSVVCPDLRGYGRSRGPEPEVDHAPHSKRAVATDILKSPGNSVMSTTTSPAMTAAATSRCGWRWTTPI